MIESENKRRQATKAIYTTSADEYMTTKYSSVDSVMAVIDAELCLKSCQRSKDVLAKTLEQNLQEFYANIQLCYKDQEIVNGGQREVDYQGVIGCLESNMTILSSMDKRLNDELLSKQDILFKF